jgi:hypothetical protein
VLGASNGELAFVAVLLVIVIVAQLAPRIGEAVAVRFAASRKDGGRTGSKAPSREKPPAA